MYLCICLSIYLSICLSTSLKTKLFCETSPVFELDNIRSAAILRDLFNFCTWQRQNRSNPARLPQLFKLTTSKTKQFCETCFKMIFPFGLFKVLRLPRKKWSGWCEVLHLSRKIILANLKTWCSKMQPLSTSLMNMSLVLRVAREMHRNASL